MGNSAKTIHDNGLPVVSCSCQALADVENLQKTEFFEFEVPDLCTVYRLDDKKYCCGQQDLHEPSFLYFIFNDIIVLVSCIAGAGYGFYHLQTRYKFFKTFCKHKDALDGINYMQQMNDEPSSVVVENEGKNTIVLEDLDD